MIEMFLLEQLAAFEKYGTLSAAAEALHITQPALSRSMKKLEVSIGVSLFDRSNSKIALNETGKVAAGYARKVLEANQEMLERTIAFDRSRRTLVLGACAALPVNLLLPVLQNLFPGMAITSEITDDDRLLRELKNHSCNLAVLHTLPCSEDIFCRKYVEEHLSVAFPADHPLASRREISFQDLKGMSILAHGAAGFWIDLCRKQIPECRLLTQESVDTLYELVDSSSLPAFSSDRAAERGPKPLERITVPIHDSAAHVVYYLACLQSEKEKYEAVFRAVSRETEQRL